MCSRLQVRLGYIARKRAVEAVMQQESESRLRREQAEVVAQLQPLQKPFLPEVVARVEDWAKTVFHFRFSVQISCAPGAFARWQKHLGKMPPFRFAYVYPEASFHSNCPGCHGR